MSKQSNSDRDDLLADALVSEVKNLVRRKQCAASARPNPVQLAEMANEQIDQMLPPIPKSKEALVRDAWMMWYDAKFASAGMRTDRQQDALQHLIETLTLLADRNLCQRLFEGFHRDSTDNLRDSFTAILDRTPEAASLAIDWKALGPLLDSDAMQALRPPTTAVRPENEPGRRTTTRWKIEWVAGTAVALACMYFGFLRPSSDSPRDFVEPIPAGTVSPTETGNQTKGDDSQVLLTSDRQYRFKKSHPRPMKHQWLIHIDSSVRVVGHTGAASTFNYEFTPTYSPRDYDYFVIVTSDAVPPQFPTSGLELEGVDLDLLKVDEIQQLIAPRKNQDKVHPDAETTTLLRNAFTRTFENSKFSLYIDRLPYRHLGQ